MSSSLPSGAQIPPVQHVWTIGPSDRRRYIWLATRLILLQWRFAVSWVFLAALVGLGLLLNRTASYVVDVAAVALIALPVLVWFAAYRSTRTGMSPGTQWTSGLNDHGFTLTTPAGTAVLNWDTITAVEPRRGLIAIKTQSRPRGALYLVETLFPPEAVAYANSQIARRRGHPG